MVVSKKKDRTLLKNRSGVEVSSASETSLTDTAKRTTSGSANCGGENKVLLLVLGLVLPLRGGGRRICTGNAVMV